MKFSRKLFHFLFKNFLFFLFFSFIIWMLFFDENSLIRFIKIKKEIDRIENKLMDLEKINKAHERNIKKLQELLELERRFDGEEALEEEYQNQIKSLLRPHG